MPEKPEVVTVSRSLETKILGKLITDCHVYWNNIIVGDIGEFERKIKNQTIESITTRGKWIVIFLSKSALLIHLRMEGKFFFRKKGEERSKHEHVVFEFSDGWQMRFHDVRKFGKMILLSKENVFNMPPLNMLGYEYDDKRLTANLLCTKLSSKSIPIKTALLDQTIIAGIGNIYDDEILFASKVHPLKKSNEITIEEAVLIIENTRKILSKAIQMGGTTIKSFTSSEGVHGLFQNELSIHGKKGSLCPVCGDLIMKIKVNGRGTYYCEKCQNSKN